MFLLSDAKFIVLSSIILLQIIEGHCQNPIKWKHPSHFIKPDDPIEEYCTCDFSKKFSKEAANENKEADLIRYYEKILKFLFKKEDFHKDPNSNYFIRNVPLRVTEDQLLELNVLELSVAQIDSLVGKIFINSKDENLQISLKTLLAAFYEQEIQSKISLISSHKYTILSAVGGLLIAYLLYRNIYRPSISGILIFSLLVIFSISYAMAFIDCQYDLEAENIIEMTKLQNNPCEDYKKEQTSYFSFAKRLVMGSSEDKCHQYMKKTLRPQKTWCDPGHVLLKMLAFMNISFLQTVMENVSEMTTKMTGSLGFVQKMAMWPILFVLLIIIIVITFLYFIKFFFRFLSESKRNIDPEKLRSSPEHLNQIRAPTFIVLNSSKLEQLGIQLNESAVEIIPETSESLKNILPQLESIQNEEGEKSTINNTEDNKSEDENKENVENASFEANETQEQKKSSNVTKKFTKFFNKHKPKTEK